MNPIEMLFEEIIIDRDDEIEIEIIDDEIDADDDDADAVPDGDALADAVTLDEWLMANA